RRSSDLFMLISADSPKSDKRKEEIKWAKAVAADFLEGLRDDQQVRGLLTPALAEELRDLKIANRPRSDPNQRNNNHRAGCRCGGRVSEPRGHAPWCRCCDQIAACQVRGHRSAAHS